jgi:hypothetical protein
MRAVRLHAWERRSEVHAVPEPAPRSCELLLRATATGFTCTRVAAG